MVKDVVTKWKVVVTANLSHSFTNLIDYMYILCTSRCRIKFGVERIYFQAKQIIFECATLRILRSSINLFVWTKKKKKQSAPYVPHMAVILFEMQVGLCLYASVNAIHGVFRSHMLLSNPRQI